jgi:TolA-binding protein
LKTLPASAALAAALLLSGCAGAGGDAVARRDLEALRGEVQALRQENLQLMRSLDQLATRVDALALRPRRLAGELARAAPVPGPAASLESAAVPDGLAVVRVEPPRASRAPPVPTGTPLVEPDAARLDAIARKSGRDLAGDADAELKAARRREPLARAHALEDFVARYPRHPQAGGALLEAAAAYAGAGKVDAACRLDRRVVDEYPASEQVSDALLQLAGCEGRRGAADLERRYLARVVNDFPSSPAARRARERLESNPGRPGADPSPDGPARSGQ